MDDTFVKPVFAPPGEEEAKISETPRILHAEIDNTNRNFKGQHKHETVLCFTRRHWIVLLPYIIGSLLIMAGLFYLAISTFRTDMADFISPIAYKVVAGAVIAVITYYLHRFFVRFLNYYLQIIIVTNFRVIELDITLFFNNNRDSIDLPEIQDVVIRQEGILKTLLNFGELIITLSSVNASKSLYYVPNPEYFFRKINKTKREYIITRRLQKGLHEPIAQSEK
ncbi:MAG: hypothetical protein AAB606_01255 [Patescibacteria group bacterium]